MMKIKVAFGNDMRLFKYEGASLSEAYDTLTCFVLNTFGIRDFRFQYMDDEDDLITVTSEHELDEAFDFALEQGKTLKLFVVAVAAQPATTAVQQQETIAEGDAPASEEKGEVPLEETPTTDEGSNVEETIDELVKLLIENEGFRQEFASFAQDVVLQLREDDGFETAVETALAAHESLAAHPFVRDHFLKILPFVAIKAGFAVPFLKSMEPSVIPSMIEHAVQGIHEGQHMMPFLGCMLGGADGFGGCGGFSFGSTENCSPETMGPFGEMPFFGGGFPHGRPHGRCHPRGHGFRRRGCGFRGGCGGRGRGHHGFGRFSGKGGRCGKKANRAFRADIVDPNVTLEDKALVLPNSSVVKTWRIRNTGQEAFPEGTKLKYVGKPFNKLVDGVEFPVESIPVDEEGEISVLLTTPREAGRFGSAWRLQLPDGTPFGPLLRARVQVASGVTVAESSSDSDADSPATGTFRAKKAKKLEKLMAKKAKLEARLAKLGSKIAKARSWFEEESRVGVEQSGEVKEELDDGEDDDDVVFVDVDVDATANTDAQVDIGGVRVTEDEEFVHELAALQSMGFGDLELNRMLLRQHNGQMDAVVSTLL